MHETLNGVGFIHHTDPGAEAGIGEAITKAADNVEDDEDWPWRMQRKGNKRDYMAYRRHHGNTALPKLEVDPCIGEGSNGVSDEGGEEYERHDGVRQVVVDFELYFVSIN